MSAAQSPDEDARWDDIVANYGDRPTVEDAWTRPEPAPAPRPPQQDTRAPVRTEPEWWEREPEPFVPPTPPPIPRTSPVRTASWVFVIGGPLVLVALAIFRVALPTSGVLIAIAATLASFGHLLWTASPAPREPWDDGSQV